MTKRTIITLAAAMLAAAPAFAQSADWAAAKAGFAEGVAANVPIADREGYAMCGAFWSKWSEAAHKGRVPAEVGRMIDPQLVAPDSGMVALQWLMTMTEPVGNETEDAAEADAERYLKALGPVADEKVGAALGGDATAMRGVMNVLAACRMRDE